MRNVKFGDYRFSKKEFDEVLRIWEDLDIQSHQVLGWLHNNRSQNYIKKNEKVA